MKNNSTRVWLITILLAQVVVNFGCKSNELPTKRLDFSKSETPSATSLTKDASVLRVAVSGMTSPQETHKFYSALVQYLGGKTKRSVQLIQRKSYQEINNLLLKNELDLAFLCTGAYLDKSLHEKVDLLAVPVIRGKATYQSYLVVQKNSTIHHISELQNRRFAYSDSLSLTGCLYPQWKLIKQGYQPRQFFKQTFFTGAHDRSIQAVIHGMVDGACVDGLIFDYLSERRPDEVKNIKVVDKSIEFGMPPIVVPKTITKDLQSALSSTFLNMHSDDEGKEILSGLRIDRFIQASSGLYETAEEIVKVSLVR